MTKFSLKSLASILIAATLISGCALKKMKKKQNTISYEVVPEVLEVNGDSVRVTINGVLPKKYFNKRATAELKPVIRYQGGEVKLESYKLKGEKVAGDGTIINKKTGGQFSYSDIVPYTPEMKKSELWLGVSAKRKKKTVEFTEVKLADGIVTTSLTAKPTEELLLGKDNYQKVVPIENKGTIYFEIDRAVVRESEKKGTDVQGLMNFVKAGNKLTGITISSYASPDGELRRNDQLSIQRTEATYAYLRNMLKSLGVEQVNDSSFYKRSATAEDWDGLKQIASSSNIEDRDKIINIVSTVSDVEQREKEIKKLPSYKKIADQLLPRLRRSEITLIGTEARRPDAEIAALASSDPSKLTNEELLYAGTMTQNMSQQLANYEAFRKQYPNDWRGYNNIAYIYLKQGGKEEEALTLLEKANTLSKDNPVVYNNMGVAFRNQGKYKDAESYYLLAKSFGANETINLGNIKVKQGDYTSALAYYGSANGCTYNSALANTLAGNYDAAVKNIDCSKQDASTYYLKAIVGARSGNLDMLTTNLTRAIKEDPSYRETAKNDLEFRKYMETDAFKVAIR